jgi:hypothetical protein
MSLALVIRRTIMKVQTQSLMNTNEPTKSGPPQKPAENTPRKSLEEYIMSDAERKRRLTPEEWAVHLRGEAIVDEMRTRTPPRDQDLP